MYPDFWFAGIRPRPGMTNLEPHIRHARAA
jgi:hypothetical protein